MSDNIADMKKIGELIRTQDNRVTDAPIFIVEENRRELGYEEDYGEGFVWINHELDYEEANERLTKILNKRQDDWRTTWDWNKVYYRYDWHFVTACFTEQGCKDYLKINGHNHKETRIYAHGSFRNEEYRKVREMLKGL